MPAHVLSQRDARADAERDRPGKGSPFGWRLGAILVLIAFIASQLSSQSAFGLGWDMGLGNLFFGERYTYYWQTFQGKYLDFRTELAYHQSTPINTFLSPFRDYPYEFPGYWDTVSAGSMRLAGDRWGWLDPIDAFHLPTILLTGLFLWLFFRWTERRLGGLAALTAVILLASFPRLWADAHFNVKDVPEMVFFSLTVMAYAEWYENPSWRRAALTGLAAAMALAVKANALFLPFVLVLGVWRWLPPRAAARALILHLRRTWAQYLLMGAIVLLFYWLAWPLIHAEPTRALDYFRYIASQGSRAGSALWSLQPVRMLGAVLPVGLLLLLITGIVIAALPRLRAPQPILRLALAWLLVPLVRVSMPGSANFDGIRHFLEVLPAIALLAGFAAAWLVERASRRGSAARVVMLALLLLLIVTPLADAWQRYGAYQHIYFNRLVGGQARAAQVFGDSEAADYWGVTYRAGMDWLDQNAPPGALLVTPVAPWLVDLTAPIWLREDIRVVPVDAADAGAFEGFVMLITNSGARVEPLGAECMHDPAPVFSLRVDGYAIMQICRLDLGG